MDKNWYQKARKKRLNNYFKQLDHDIFVVKCYRQKLILESKKMFKKGFKTIRF